MKKIVLFTLAASLISVNATADVLYNNLYDSSGGVDPIASTGPIADSFSTGNYDVTLTDVQLYLNASNTSSTGSFTVSLLADNGNTPGALINYLGTFSDNVLTSSNNLFDPLFTGNYILAANTRYWIELTATSDSTANWVYDLNANPSTEYVSNVNGTFPNSNGPYEMAVYAAPVPLPPSFILMGLGFAGMMGFRRKAA